jgi:pilus assembly protein CpaC
VALAFAPGCQAQQNDASPDELFVVAGKSILVNTAVPVARIAVGSMEIAEVTVISPQQLMLNGKAAGTTSLILWQAGGGQQFFDVTVRPSTFAADARLDSARRQLKKELPGQAIDVTSENETLFLRGKVSDALSAERAAAIAGALGKVVNLLYVDAPPAETQILLRVRFASVDRSRSSALGLNLISTGAANTVGTLGTQQFSPPVVVPNASGTATVTLADALNLFLLRSDLNLGATIKALETRGLLQILAEPNVLAIDGRRASFLAGGEFPFPTIQGGGSGVGQITIQFREYGIRLNFTPRITPRGTIHLDVAPEVSALDYTNGLTVQGFSVPALTTRKMSTEVELGEGQSFAIGGLIDNRLTKTFEKIPFLGDIPILGKFFQSQLLNRNNTELLVIVTPEIVRPIPVGMEVPKLELPEKFLTPNTKGDITTPGIGKTGPVPAATFRPVPYERLQVNQQTAPASNLAPVPGSGPASGSVPGPAPGPGMTPVSPMGGPPK